MRGQNTFANFRCSGNLQIYFSISYQNKRKKDRLSRIFQKQQFQKDFEVGRSDAQDFEFGKTHILSSLLTNDGDFSYMVSQKDRIKAQFGVDGEVVGGEHGIKSVYQFFLIKLEVVGQVFLFHSQKNPS